MNLYEWIDLGNAATPSANWTLATSIGWNGTAAEPFATACFGFTTRVGQTQLFGVRPNLIAVGAPLLEMRLYIGDAKVDRWGRVVAAPLSSDAEFTTSSSYGSRSELAFLTPVTIPSTGVRCACTFRVTNASGAHHVRADLQHAPFPVEGWGAWASEGLPSAYPSAYVWDSGQPFVPMIQARYDAGGTGDGDASGGIEAHPLYASAHVAEGVSPTGYGAFGPEYTQFKGDYPGAREHLMMVKAGIATGALWHPEIGDIDLPWGEEPGKGRKGYGLSKILIKHPEVVDDLAEKISGATIDREKSTELKIQLKGEDFVAAVNKVFQGLKATYLVTSNQPSARGRS